MASLQGMNLFKAAVVVCILAVLYGVLSSKMAVLGEQTERTAMQNVLNQLQQQLNFHLASLYIKGGAGRVQALADDNPFQWLDQAPGNYRGEISSIEEALQSADVEVWFFNTQTHELIYKANRHQFLKTTDENQQILRFVLNLSVPTADNVSKATVYSAQFEAVAPFDWQITATP